MSAEVITLPFFATEREGVEHFFGTRHLAENSSSTVGASMSWRSSPRRKAVLVSVKQVHGIDALVLDEPVEAGQVFDGEWDALVTNQPGVVVAVRTADCVPVLLHDRQKKVVAAIHAGWRGAVAGIVSRVISTMAEQFGADPAGLRMAIGPSAGPCCYEVDEPVLSRVREGVSDWHRVAQTRGTDKAMLDLRRLVRYQGLEMGLREDHIGVVNACTICHPELFFSYRREGVVKRSMISGIALLPNGRSRRH